MKIRILAISALAGSFALQSTTAYAQTPNDEDIVITARKRQESILKVPVVATVLTQAAMENYQLRTVYDLATRVPSLFLAEGVQTAGVQASIRGVGTTAIEPSVEQSVALNLDGVNMTQGLSFNVGLFDLAQTEVLKGPQALFFGKNSPGGVISLRTNDPGDKFELIGRAGYEFVAREYNTELIVSGPVTPTLGIRVATKYADAKGYFKNTAIATPNLGGKDPKYRRFPNNHTFIVRGTSVWKPSDKFDARFKFNYAKRRVNGDAGSPTQLKSCPDGISAPAGVNFFGPGEDCKLDRKVNVVDLDPRFFRFTLNDGVLFSKQTLKIGSMELNYRPTDEIDITSLTGRTRSVAQTQINATSSGAAGPAIFSTNDFGLTDFTQELRVNSSFASPVNFTAGGFIQRSRLYNRGGAFGNLAVFPVATLNRYSHVLKTRTKSVFGQLRWKPSTVIEISGGVRYTDETKRDTQRNLATGNAVLAPLPVPKIGSKTWSPEFTVTYTPTDDLTLFASLKQGYKSGSFQIIGLYTADNTFKDEKVQGGEVGLKMRALDGALRMEMAGYYYRYSDLQVGASETPLNGIPIIRTTNAASAKVYGIEWQANYRPPALEDLRLNANVNYNHARYGNFVTAPCWGGQTQAQGCNLAFNPTTQRFVSQDLSGEPLLRAPNWQLGAGADYETDIGNDMRLSVGVNGTYSSRYLVSLLARADMYQSAYLKANANVILKGPEDRWQLSCIVNNLTDKIVANGCSNTAYATGAVLPGTITGGTTVGPAGTDEVFCRADPGRQLWVRAGFKF